MLSTVASHQRFGFYCARTNLFKIVINRYGLYPVFKKLATVLRFSVSTSLRFTLKNLLKWPAMCCRFSEKRHTPSGRCCKKRFYHIVERLRVKMFTFMMLAFVILCSQLFGNNVSGKSTIVIISLTKSQELQISFKNSFEFLSDKQSLEK